VLAEFFKQAIVKASRFDANDKNCGIQHILQRSISHISTATLQNQKRFYCSRTSAFVVCSSSQNRNSSFNVSWLNVCHENKQLSAWSNICWLIPSKRKQWSCRCFHFIYHLVFHIFRHIWNAPLISIAGKRYSSHVCLTSFSKKLLYCFQQKGVSQAFFQSCEVIYLAISSATSMMPVLVETSGKINLGRFKLAS